MQKSIIATIVAVGMLVTGCQRSIENVSSQAKNQEPDMLFDRVKHHYVDNDGVNIHYVTLGEGEITLLFVHGAPDFWYLWNNQMDGLCDDYHCVAMDTNRYR